MNSICEFFTWRTGTISTKILTISTIKKKLLKIQSPVYTYIKRTYLEIYKMKLQSRIKEKHNKFYDSCLFE